MNILNFCEITRKLIYSKSNYQKNKKNPLLENLQ